MWSGSSLTVYHETEPTLRQLRLVSAALAAGVPQWGSCWGMQLAARAAGLPLARNPRGREVGLARAVRPTEHEMLAGRSGAFDALCMHSDHVCDPSTWGALAKGVSATVLAGNAWSPVQAIEIKRELPPSDSARRFGVFWGTQYHPEFTLHEVARLTDMRAAILVKEGTFRDAVHAADFVAALDRLSEEVEGGEAEGVREAEELLFRLHDEQPHRSPVLPPSILGGVTDEAQRTLEFGNFVAAAAGREEDVPATSRLGAGGVPVSASTAVRRRGGPSTVNLAPVLSASPRRAPPDGVRRAAAARAAADAVGWRVLPRGPLGAELLGPDLASPSTPNPPRRLAI